MDLLNRTWRARLSQSARRLGCVALMLILAGAWTGCAQPEEFPLILPPAAEPSADKHNDFGIAAFRAGDYHDARLHFRQATVADKSAGEIYFNLGLAMHMEGDRDQAVEQFRLARKFANGNAGILDSKILNEYLDKK